MRSSPFPMPRLIACAWLLAAGACARPERLKPIFPPSADLKAATAPKPIPGPEIVSSAASAAAFDVAIEAWGDGLSAAGGRICRWAARNGASLDFPCPPVTAGAATGD